jgi:hypothetical protein
MKDDHFCPNAENWLRVKNLSWQSSVGSLQFERREDHAEASGSVAAV